MSKLDEAQNAALKAAVQMGMDPVPGLGPALTAPTSTTTSETTADERVDSAVKNQTLSVEEVQALKEMIYERHRRKRQEFNLPEMPITEEDKKRFEDCVAARVPFCEIHSMLNGKLSVKFKTKNKRENDVMFEQLDLDFKAGRIRSEAAYVTLLNNYNIMFQMVEMQGVKLASPIPVVPLPDWSLHAAMKAHIIDTLPESNIWLLIAALAQFDNKVRYLSQEALKGNFSSPASAS